MEWQENISPYALNIYMWFNLKDGKYYDTTRGTIHWAKDGGYHIVPAPPVNWNK